MVAQTSQDVCNGVVVQVRDLLTDNEKDILGDFYFGLTDTPSVTASCEQQGQSYLFLVHRRLFNALQFVSDVFVSCILEDSSKLELLEHYLSLVSLSKEHLTPLPNPPEYIYPYEIICSSILNFSMLRFILGHEIAHKLACERPHLPRDIYVAQPNDPLAWEEEFHADYTGALLGFRETRLTGQLQTLYFQSSLTAPFLLLRLLQVLLPSSSATHPPTSRRVLLLRKLIAATHPISATLNESELESIDQDICRSLSLIQ